MNADVQAGILAQVSAGRGDEVIIALVLCAKPQFVIGMDPVGFSHPMCPSAECWRFCSCCCCQLATDPRPEPPNPDREDRSLPRENSEGGQHNVRLTFNLLLVTVACLSSPVL